MNAFATGIISLLVSLLIKMSEERSLTLVVGVPILLASVLGKGKIPIFLSLTFASLYHQPPSTRKPMGLSPIPFTSGSRKYFCAMVFLKPLSNSLP